MSRVSVYSSARASALAASKELSLMGSQVPLRGVELDSDQIGLEEHHNGAYGSDTGSGHDAPEASYEASQVNFAKALRSPLTTMVVGRGANPVSYLIHTSILAPYPHFTKALVKVGPASSTNGTSSNGAHPAEQNPGGSAALTSQLPLKEYDAQTASSLLEFLYTGEYWPSIEHFSGLSQSIFLKDGASREEASGREPLFTNQALTAHHFKIALLSSKYAVEGLLKLAREKMVLTLQNLPPHEVLEVIRVVYSKGFLFREKFFEFLSADSLEHEDKRRGVGFWGRELLDKLMGYEQEVEEFGSDGVGLKQVSTVKDRFLAMIEGGGELASDVVRASWEVVCPGPQVTSDESSATAGPE